MTDSVPGSPARALTRTADDRGRIKHRGTTGRQGQKRYGGGGRLSAPSFACHMSRLAVMLRGRFRSKRVAPTSASASAAGLID
jgi:hypothetical protein